MEPPRETYPYKEGQTTVEHAWLFDVDGVITNPQTKRTNPELMFQVARGLARKEPVILITGRSLQWLEERVLGDLHSALKDSQDETMLYISAEFGGAYMRFRNGKLISFIDESISVSQNLYDSAVNLVESEFSDVVFIDKTKKTMVSVEMNSETTEDQFRKRRGDIDRKLKDLLERLGLQDRFMVHSDRIATNVRDIKANKHYAIEQILKWLEEDKIKPKKFIVFGDSIGDLEMGKELQKNNKMFDFVFVGGREELVDSSLPFPIIYTQAYYEKGTLEYLQIFNRRN